MIYKTKVFQARFKKATINDENLIAACKEMDKRLVDADLGCHLYKKRIAIQGKGKSGSYRTIVGAVIGERYFLLYLFAKSDKSNLSKQETLTLKELAKEYVKFNRQTINDLVKDGKLLKVEQNDE